MALNPTIIVVEDDKDLNQYLSDFLSENKYLVHAVEKGTRALQLIEQTNPNLVLLDLGLPDIQGESLCTKIKDAHPDLPVIILTAKDNVQDIIAGLNLGADDYITKPFSEKELIARINARLRSNHSQAVMNLADLEVNSETLEVKRSDKLISLTQTEFRLLHYLLANKNHVLSREAILNHVWSYTPDIESRVVDVYIGYLRKKIDKDFNPKLIHSMRGFGYSIKEPSKHQLEQEEKEALRAAEATNSTQQNASAEAS